MTKRKSVGLIILIICSLVVLLGIWLKRDWLVDQLGKPQEISVASLTYPPLIDATRTLPDTLQYFYNSIDCRGTALSTGEFYVKIKYPVLRLPQDAARRYETWLLEQVFILGTNAETEKIEAYKRNRDIAGYAQDCLDTWLAGEETRYMGCLQESLAVEVVLNDEIITLRKSHGGYWGGAHGDASVAYQMFDSSFRPIDCRTLFAKDKLELLQRLLAAEYDSQVDPGSEYDLAYKMQPESTALLPEGLIAVFYGRSYAEGMQIVKLSPKKFRQWLKPEFRQIYANSASINSDPRSEN